MKNYSGQQAPFKAENLPHSYVRIRKECSKGIRYTNYSLAKEFLSKKLTPNVCLKKIIAVIPVEILRKMIKKTFLSMYGYLKGRT